MENYILPKEYSYEYDGKNLGSVPLVNFKRKIIIIGAGTIAINIAKILEINEPDSSITIIENNKEPKYKNVFKFSLSGLKKLIFDIYFSLIAIFLLYQFINIEIDILKLR